MVWPKLGQWTDVVLAKPYEYKYLDINNKPTGKVQLMPRRVRAMVLSYGGEHFIAINRWRTGSEGVKPDPSGLLTESVSRNYFGTYRRVASTTQPITSLRLAADEAENITVSYTLQDGCTHSLKLDEKRNVIEQH